MGTRLDKIIISHCRKTITSEAPTAPQFSIERLLRANADRLATFRRMLVSRGGAELIARR
jgi:hypothetical protein